jgi:hypothetical protein
MVQIQYFHRLLLLAVAAVQITTALKMELVEVLVVVHQVQLVLAVLEQPVKEMPVDQLQIT